MEYVRFGRTEATVSRLGFGGAPVGLGNYLEQYDPKVEVDRQGVIDAALRAVELGVTYSTRPQVRGTVRARSFSAKRYLRSRIEPFWLRNCLPARRTPGAAWQIIWRDCVWTIWT